MTQNIVVAGKNSISVDILDYIINEFNVSPYVILNKNDPFKDGFQKSLGKFALENKLNVVQLSEIYKLDNLLFISLEFDKIIDPLKFKSDRLYNVHFSLLPAYKGMFTSAWPILNAEKYSGVTLHEIDSGIDTGPIIDQFKIEISKNFTSRDLYMEYIKYGTLIVKKNLKSLINSDYTSRIQSFNNSTYYSKSSIDFKNLIVNFNKTAFEVINQIRAFSFKEYQLPKINQYEIIGWEVIGSKSKIKPGNIINTINDTLIVSTIDYDIKLKVKQL